jgi:hypothetical protein
MAALAPAALLVLAVALYAGDAPKTETTTMAEAYGLRKSQIASFDDALCSRLIRFGKVALERGRYVEAKRFFWKAVLVDPTSKLGWHYYDQAVLFTLAHNVERMPGLVGLPGLSEPGDGAPEVVEPELEEGC